MSASNADAINKVNKTSKNGGGLGYKKRDEARCMCSVSGRISEDAIYLSSCPVAV